MTSRFSPVRLASVFMVCLFALALLVAPALLVGTHAGGLAAHSMSRVPSGPGCIAHADDGPGDGIMSDDTQALMQGVVIDFQTDDGTSVGTTDILPSSPDPIVLQSIMANSTDMPWNSPTSAVIYTVTTPDGVTVADVTNIAVVSLY
jgi:hypothetical protein